MNILYTELHCRYIEGKLQYTQIPNPFFADKNYACTN